MIILNIDFKKIDQSRLKKTAKGSFGDLVLIDHPSEHNGIHSDGFVKQGVTKEEREARVEMPIIGNWKRVGGDKQPAQAARQQAKPQAPDDDGSGIPF
jgi:hypothetical protein